MPATQQAQQFTTEEAQRFASLMAGADTTNPAEHEAMGKLRQLRRMAGAKGLRLVDVFELPEIRQAIDDQLQPVRAANTDAAASAEMEELRGKLALVVPKVRELTEALTREKELTRKLADEIAVGKNLLTLRQREFDEYRRRAGTAGNASGINTPALGAQSWVIETTVVIAAFVLLVMKVLLSIF